MLRKKKTVVAMAVSSLAGVAAAQQAAPAPAAAASAAEGDAQRVIITAQKRKEDIQKVPLSVSVVSGEQLQANQIATFDDLTRNIPNVSFNSQAGAGLSTIEI